MPRVSNIFFLAGIVDILGVVANVMTINIEPSKKMTKIFECDLIIQITGVRGEEAYPRTGAISVQFCIFSYEKRFIFVRQIYSTALNLLYICLCVCA